MTRARDSTPSRLILFYDEIMQCNRKIGKKCLRLERHWLILLPLKIVLGGTTARRNIRCGGLYLFEVPEFCAWRTSQFPNLALKLCLSVSPRALTRLPWLAVGGCSVRSTKPAW